MTILLPAPDPKLTINPPQTAWVAIAGDYDHFFLSEYGKQ
jgi:hypothetical protein